MTNSVFEQIGFPLRARAYLVGFAADEAATFSICFEPQTDSLAQVALDGIDALAQQRYEAGPWSNFFVSDPHHHARIQQELLNTARASIIEEHLETSVDGARCYFFVGQPGSVEGFQVHPVIAVPRELWNSKPALQRTEIENDRFGIARSLQHSLIRELLRKATEDLGRHTPPTEFSAQWSDRSELIRKAAQALVTSVCRLSGDDFSSEIALSLNEVSAQAYEGRTSAGGFLIADPASPDVTMTMEFAKPIRLSDTRSLRKALEMTGGGRYLLCRDAQVLGLAIVDQTYDPADETAFTFEIVGRGSWQLAHTDKPLLRMTDTRPSLPRPRIDQVTFRDIAERVFPQATPSAIDRMWQATLQATEAAHGTMLVVHPAAASEAKRLYPQAQLIQPTFLDSTTLGAATNIDGAVMLDPEGQCHAVGVILDGKATGTGRASRGARFNSAVRYHQARGSNALIIIASEDGMIDILPNLNRRVARSQVETAVSLLESTVTVDPDYEEFFRFHDHVESLKFYLSSDQCDRVNRARDAIERHREQTTNLTITGWARFAPAEGMNDSYFID